MFREFFIVTILFVLTTDINAVINDAELQNLPYTSHGNYLYKCCPMGEYVGKRKNCVKYNKTLSFSKIEVYDDDLSGTGKSIEDVFKLLPGKFEDEAFRIDSLDITTLFYNAYVTKSSVLQLEVPNMYHRWTPILRENFCVDYRILLHNRAQMKPRFWVILPTEDNVDTNVYLTGATLISCFFMLLMLIVYFSLPELQTLRGKILMASVGSLFMAYLLLAVIQLQLHTWEACIGLTMGIYFFFLASFCWMSVMSYDIWWTLRCYVKARPIHQRGELFKFLVYCLFAWGVPLSMTIGLAVLNEVDMSHLPWFVTPQVPQLGCFLEGGAKLLYLYIPMLILILFNWMFYLMIAFNVWRSSRGSAVTQQPTTTNNPQAHRKHRFMVYLQLSIVMGLNWLLEIVSFLNPGVKVLYITDTYNVLIGIVIFFIFVCKKEIFRKLYKRYLGKKKTTSSDPSSKSYNSSTLDSSIDTTKVESKPSNLQFISAQACRGNTDCLIGTYK